MRMCGVTEDFCQPQSDKKAFIKAMAMKMKLSLIPAILALLISVGAFAQDKKPDPKFYIFICFGQSNMEGAGPITDAEKTVDPRFQMLACVDMPQLNRKMGQWYPATAPLCRGNSKVCPADYFGRTMIANLPPDVKVGILNVSVGGCSIDLFDKDKFNDYIPKQPQWMKSMIKQYDDNPYQRLVDMAKLAQKDGVIRGILLHQGETNTGDKDWPDRVKKVYGDLIKDLGLKAEETPLLAGEVVNADQQGQCASFNTNVLVNLPTVLPNSYIISSKGCPSMERLHFSTEGYKVLGTRYAEQMLKIMGIESKAAAIQPAAVAN
jgi:hypothetical protein